MLNNQITDINFNEFEELKKNVITFSDACAGIIVTSDTLSESKQILADLRKRKKEISDRRIAVKKEFMTPIEAFETKVKEITNILATAETKIDSDIKYFESIEKEEKENLVNNIIKEIVGDKFEHYHFFKEAYINKAYNEKKIRAAVLEDFERANKEVDIIVKMFKDYVDVAINEYGKVLDIDIAIKNIESMMLAKTKLDGTACKERDALKKIKADSLFSTEEQVTVKYTGTYSQIEALNDYALALGLTREDD